MDPIKTEIVVVGAGPGGYAAAFYAADLGKKVILVERDKRLGGVCLNRGCIPSKALLHAAHTITSARESEHRGITFAAPSIDVAKLRTWKESILTRLAGGIAQLAKMRGVQVMQGRGYFEDSHTLRVETEQGQQFINYDHAIVAVGSKPAMPRDFDLGNPRIMTSTEALEVEDIPENLLVIGGGYIGMELGTVYATLGSKVVVVEALDSILAGADPDLARPVVAYAKKAFKEIRLKTKVSKMSTSGKQIKVESETDGQKKEELYDRVLVAVGRAPNAEDLGLENTKVSFDERASSRSTRSSRRPTRPSTPSATSPAACCWRTRRPRKARIAVEVIAGEDSAFVDIIIPGGGLHRSGSGLVRLDRGRSQGQGHRGAGEQVPVGGFRAGVDLRPSRGHDQADHRAGHRTDSGRGHRRAGRRRTDRRRRAGGGDGRDGEGPGPDRPSAPDVVRDADGSRRSLLRPRHAHHGAQEGGVEVGAPEI